MTDTPFRKPVPVLDRRRFLAGTASIAGLAALGGLAAACGSSSKSTASSPTTVASGTTATTGAGTTAETTAKVNVALGWIKNVEFAGLWLADHNGYFEGQKISANIIAGGPNAPDPTVTVAAGSANIGVSSDMTTLLEAISKGNDFVFIGATFQTSPGCIVSLASHPVRTAKDLVGIKFLGQQGVQTDLNAILKLAGLPLKYTFIPVGFTPEPLVQHQGQAFSAFATNEVITLEQQGLKVGKDIIVTTYAQLGLPSYSDIYFASKKYIAANRDVVVRFMRAVVQGWEMNLQSTPTIAAELAVKTYGSDLGLSMQQQVLENEAQIPFMKSALTAEHGLLSVDPTVLGGAMYKALIASGVTHLPPATSVVDASILADVYKGAATIPV
jgi:ABC-type nitrate/sulfonate/bicarbonate transport system substrate-binding protein